jgi:hypothetical protein
VDRFNRNHTPIVAEVTRNRTTVDTDVCAAIDKGATFAHLIQHLELELELPVSMIDQRPFDHGGAASMKPRSGRIGLDDHFAVSVVGYVVATHPVLRRFLDCRYG